MCAWKSLPKKTGGREGFLYARGEGTFWEIRDPELSFCVCVCVGGGAWTFFLVSLLLLANESLSHPSPFLVSFTDPFPLPPPPLP